jgi:hypothetical protein
MAGESARNFLEAARRGINWISAHQKADGSFCDPEDGVGSYYKIPYALSLAGRQRDALRLLEWVARHHFTTEGDFRAPQRKALSSTHEAWPVYSNAWLILGAHRTGRWDLAMRGAEFLLRYQVPAGGFYSLDGPTRALEPVCTSWGGLAALATGHLDAACRAGDLLVRLVKAQSDPQRFYFRMDIEGKLIADVPAGQELYYYVDATRKQQIYYNPGIALILLAHLYRATGRADYLGAAQDILAFTTRCADDVHRFPPSGKLGVGCALMYGITGRKEALHGAVAVGEYLVETQTAEGFWRLPDVEPYSPKIDPNDSEVWLDVSAEFTTFLMEIASRI